MVDEREDQVFLALIPTHSPAYAVAVEVEDALALSAGFLVCAS